MAPVHKIEKELFTFVKVSKPKGSTRRDFVPNIVCDLSKVAHIAPVRYIPPNMIRECQAGEAANRPNPLHKMHEKNIALQKENMELRKKIYMFQKLFEKSNRQKLNEVLKIIDQPTQPEIMVK